MLRNRPNFSRQASARSHLLNKIKREEIKHDLSVHSTNVSSVHEEIKLTPVTDFEFDNIYHCADTVPTFNQESECKPILKNIYIKKIKW